MNYTERLTAFNATSELLEGRRALVTGATGGIGKAIVIQLLAAGADVIAHCRLANKNTMDLFKAKNTSGKLSTISADLNDPAAVEEMAQTALDRFGSIDIIINNAATASDYKDFQELSISALKNTFNTNLIAPFLIIQKLWPSLEKDKI